MELFNMYIIQHLRLTSCMTRCMCPQNTVALWRWLRFMAEICRSIKTMYCAVSWK